MLYNNQGTTEMLLNTEQNQFFDDDDFEWDYETSDDNFFDYLCMGECSLSQDKSDNDISQKKDRAGIGNTDDTKNEGPTNDDANHELNADLKLRGNEHCMYPYNGYSTRDALSSNQSQSPKKKVELTSDGLNYKKAFIECFTKDKRFSKSKVEKIHKYIQERIEIPHFNREHRRCVTLYYNNFAKYKNIIIPFIRQNKNEILKII